MIGKASRWSILATIFVTVSATLNPERVDYMTGFAVVRLALHKTAGNSKFNWVLVPAANIARYVPTAIYLGTVEADQLPLDALRFVTTGFITRLLQPFYVRLLPSVESPASPPPHKIKRKLNQFGRVEGLKNLPSGF